MASWLSLRAAVHELELGEQGWVDALHAECSALFGEDVGTFVYAYRFDRRAGIRLEHLAGRETAPGFWTALEAWGGDNAHALARTYRTGPGSLRDFERAAARVGVAISNAGAAFEPHGVADVFTLVGHDPSGFGVFLTAARPRPVLAWGRTEGRALERLAAELAAAARLRERRRQESSARLSASEKRVAKLLLEGASDKAIALELGVGLSTVSTFVQRIRAKLGCRPGEELLLLRQRARSTNLHRRLELFARLTSAECAVASDLLVGLTYGEIAERRGTSLETVASQCAGVFRKCRVSGRRELAAAML